MCKIGIYLLLAVFQLSLADAWAMRFPNYPHGLIGEDFNILKESDLAANTCNTFPSPFKADKTPYPYWKCYETKNVQFHCEGNEVPDPLKEQEVMIIIEVNETKGAQERSEYLSRQIISNESCSYFMKSFKRLTRETDHVCIAGSFASKEIDTDGKPLTTWFFEKLKTKRGCQPYFQGDCDIKYLIKNGCKIKPSIPSSTP